MAVIYSALRQPLIEGNKTISQVTEDICRPVGRKPSALWWSAFLAAATVLLIGATAVAYEISTGIGTWGLNRTVGWAFDITSQGIRLTPTAALGTHRRRNVIMLVAAGVAFPLPQGFCSCLAFPHTRLTSRSPSCRLKISAKTKKTHFLREACKTKSSAISPRSLI